MEEASSTSSRCAGAPHWLPPPAPESLQCLVDLRPMTLSGRPAGECLLSRCPGPGLSDQRPCPAAVRRRFTTTPRADRTCVSVVEGRGSATAAEPRARAAAVSRRPKSFVRNLRGAKHQPAAHEPVSPEGPAAAPLSLGSQSSDVPASGVLRWRRRTPLGGEARRSRSSSVLVAFASAEARKKAWYSWRPSSGDRRRLEIPSKHPDGCRRSPSSACSSLLRAFSVSF